MSQVITNEYQSLRGFSILFSSEHEFTDPSYDEWSLLVGVDPSYVSNVFLYSPMAIGQAANRLQLPNDIVFAIKIPLALQLWHLLLSSKNIICDAIKVCDWCPAGNFVDQCSAHD